MVKITFKPISPSNYSPASYREKIDRIVIHWIVGTLESAYITFSNPTRAGSATYGVGPNEIYQFIGTDKVSWANNNWDWNTRSITIENEGGPNMPFNQKVFDNLAWLVAKEAKEHGLGMLEPGKNLFEHKQVPGASTACAGYFGERLKQLAEKANKLNGVTPGSPGQGGDKPTPHKVGERVTFTHLWTQSNGGQRLPALIYEGVITNIIAGASHPYLINGGSGWLSEGDVNSTNKTPPAPSTPQVGSTVKFSYLWTESNGGVRLKALVNSGKITHVVPGAKHPYLVGNGTGWLSKNEINGSTPTPPAPAKLKKGDTVQFTNPVDENGVRLAVSGNYTVIEVTNQHRVVVGRGGVVTAATNPKNLKKV